MVNALYIFFGVIAIIIIIFIVIGLIAKRKGSIDIQLQNYNFSYGETITGNIILKLKKPVEAKQLSVGLIGIRKSSSYKKDSQGRTIENENEDIIFNFSQPLEKQKSMNPGEYSYPFEITLPKDIMDSSTGSKFADVLVKSTQMLSSLGSAVYWYITADLDVPGIDLSKRVQINIA